MTFYCIRCFLQMKSSFTSFTTYYSSYPTLMIHNDDDTTVTCESFSSQNNETDGIEYNLVYGGKRSIGARCILVSLNIRTSTVAIAKLSRDSNSNNIKMTYLEDILQIPVRHRLWISVEFWDNGHWAFFDSLSRPIKINTLGPQPTWFVDFTSTSTRWTRNTTCRWWSETYGKLAF